MPAALDRAAAFPPTGVTAMNLRLAVVLAALSPFAALAADPPAETDASAKKDAKKDAKAAKKKADPKKGDKKAAP